MKDYQLKFLDSHHGKSEDGLWPDVFSTIDTLATQSKQILSEPSLPALLSKYDDWSDGETTFTAN